jgi:hypothetical protein
MNDWKLNLANVRYTVDISLYAGVGASNLKNKLLSLNTLCITKSISKSSCTVVMEFSPKIINGDT